MQVRKKTYLGHEIQTGRIHRYTRQGDILRYNYITVPKTEQLQSKPIN